MSSRRGGWSGRRPWAAVKPVEKWATCAVMASGRPLTLRYVWLNPKVLLDEADARKAVGSQE
jgi:hypothetical protein